MLLFFNIVVNAPLHFKTNKQSKDMIVKNKVSTTHPTKITTQQVIIE